MKNNTVTLLFKGISLLILDIVTFMIVFSAWALVNIRLFPWAFVAILFSLITVNLAIIYSEYGVKRFGIGAYVPALTSTILYYIFVMAFTGITYIGISSKWYIISILITTLVYIGTISGLYVSGNNNTSNMEKQAIEQENVLNVTLQLMKINENIKSCNNLLEKSSYMAVMEAFIDMEERLKVSTPFGRTIKPIVLNLENQIIQKLDNVNEDLILLKTLEENQTACKSVIEIISDVKSLIVNREKLIIQ